jgi:hypothetical protein
MFKVNYSLSEGTWESLGSGVRGPGSGSGLAPVRVIVSIPLDHL